MTKRLFAIALAIAAAATGLLVPSTPSGAKETKFFQTEGAVPNQYIVVLKPDTDPSLVGATTESLARTYGGEVRYVFEHAMKGFSVSMSEEAAMSLSEDSSVEFVEENGAVSADTTQPNPTWGLDRIDQRFLPLSGSYTYDNTGTGVSAYVIDTGIRPTHLEFLPLGRAVAAADFAPIDDPPPTGCSSVPPILCAFGTSGPPAIDVTTENSDCHGHGTHVAGTVGGRTYGVAKNVKIYGVKVLNCSGGGTYESVIAGINWSTAHHLMNPGPAVANMSLSGPANLSLDNAVRNSINSGITYVVAASNNNADASGWSPARVSEALTIGASNINDSRATLFSNYGPLVDLHAPGVDVLSAWNSGDSATAVLSGTSMASPHVAGVVALYLQTFPAATPPIVHAAMVNNATTGVISNLPAGTPNRLIYSRFFPPPQSPRATSTDFDGDEKTDLAVWRPSTAFWYILLSGSGNLTGMQWGSQAAGDRIVPGDYDNDNKADIAVWRPGDGTWYIVNSSNGTFRYEQFGTAGDIPVPADYDGDGITDLAVWRPSDGVWYIRNSSGGDRFEAWGLGSLGDRPVPADYDGDNKADLAVWRAPSGTWYIQNSSNSSSTTIQWGSSSSNDVLVPADYDGDGRADLAVWRPGNGIWYIMSIPTAVIRYDVFGQSGDIPVAADYDGDGRIDVAVWRPGDTVWYIKNSATGVVRYETFGLSGDAPVPSAYNR